MTHALTQAMVDAQLWTIAGWTMLHTVWIGIAIGAAAWIVRRCVHSATANLRYATALTCFTILAVAPLPIAAYVYRTHPRINSTVPASLIVIAKSAEPVNSAAPPRLIAGDDSVDTVHHDESAVPVDASSPPSVTAFNTRADSNAGSMVANSPAIEIAKRNDPSQVADRPLDVLVAWFPCIWLIGAPTTLMLLATGFLGAERLRRQSQPIEDTATLQLLRRLAASLGIHTEVAIGMCERFAGPILVGIVRPMILLPPAALLYWSPDQLEMVLLHELSHIRRRDNLVNLLQRVVEALMFFVPSVWFLSAWVRLEREHCCDRCVVASTGKAREYAQTLVEFAERRRSPSTAANSLSTLLASPMAEHQVLTRVRQILKNEDEAMKISRVLFGSVLLLIVSTVAFVGWYGATLGAVQNSFDRNSVTTTEDMFIAEAGSTTLVEPASPPEENKPARTRPAEAGSATILEPASPPDENESTGRRTTEAGSATVVEPVRPPEENEPAEPAGQAVQAAGDEATRLNSPPAAWLEQRKQEMQKREEQKKALAAAGERRPYLFTVRFLNDVNLSSPRTGVLQNVKVQPGDSVQAGDELASFGGNENEQAELDLKIAELKFQAAVQKHKELVALNYNKVTPKSDFDQQELDMNVAELEMKRQKLKLAVLIMPFSAPISGVVAEVSKHAGEIVGVGDPLVRLVNTDRFVVDGTIDIARTPAPKRGDKFRFTVQIASDTGATKPQVFDGKIDFVNSQLVDLNVYPRESDTLLKVRGIIDNRDSILRAGMTGIFELVDSTGKPIEPQQETGLTDKDSEVIGWVPDMFGVSFVRQRSRDDATSAKFFAGTNYRGGLEVDCVDPNGPAGKAGIRSGDILVGLGKWETSNFENVVYILTDATNVHPMEPLKFYILRKNDSLFGHVQFNKDYFDKHSWKSWMEKQYGFNLRGESR